MCILTYVGPSESVPVRVCVDQDVEVDLRGVLVALVAVDKLVDEVLRHGGADPLAGVDAYRKKDSFDGSFDGS